MEKDFLRSIIINFLPTRGHKSSGYSDLTPFPRIKKKEEKSIPVQAEMVNPNEGSVDFPNNFLQIYRLFSNDIIKLNKEEEVHSYKKNYKIRIVSEQQKTWHNFS